MMPEDILCGRAQYPSILFIWYVRKRIVPSSPEAGKQTVLEGMILGRLGTIIEHYWLRECRFLLLMLLQVIFSCFGLSTNLSNYDLHYQFPPGRKNLDCQRCEERLGSVAFRERFRWSLPPQSAFEIPEVVPGREYCCSICYFVSAAVPNVLRFTVYLEINSNVRSVSQLSVLFCALDTTSRNANVS